MVKIVVDGITLPDVLSAVERQGCLVSARQVERWHKADLLPRPRQVHLRGVRGSVGLYPPGTDQHVLALCRLRKQRRKLHELAFRLWWEGHEVQPRALRGSLQRLLSLPKDVQQARRKHRGAAGAAEHAALVLARRSRHPTVRQLKRHLREPADVVTALFTLLLPAFGERPEWAGDGVEEEDPEERTPAQLVFAGLGLTGAPWVPRNEAALADAFDALNIGGMRDASSLTTIIERASDEELVAARADARLLMEDLPVIVQTLTCVFGRDALGFGVFASLPHDALWLRAATVAVCIILRRAYGQQPFKALHQVIQAALPVARSFLSIWHSEPQLRQRLRARRAAASRQFTARLAHGSTDHAIA